MKQETQKVSNDNNNNNNLFQCEKVEMLVHQTSISLLNKCHQ